VHIKTPRQKKLESRWIKKYIGTRLRELRQEKGLSQADVQERTGVHRCYISRIEHGPTVPSLETLEKFAAALDVPLYRFFYEGQTPPPAPAPISALALRAGAGAGQEIQAGFLQELRDLWGRMGDHERGVLMSIAKNLAMREQESSGELARLGRSSGALPRGLPGKTKPR